MKTCHRILTGTLGAGILFGLVAAIAIPTNAAAAEVQYAEEELRSLAFATASIRLIEGTARRQILEASDEAEAAQLQEQKDMQLIAALEEAGFTSDQYAEMTVNVAADAEMNATLQGYILEEMGVVHSEAGEWERTLVRSGMAPQ